MAQNQIYQFYAELDGYIPKIWRRFQVKDNITAARFGYIVQVLFEMRASHLMALEVSKVGYLPRGENEIIWHYEVPIEDLEPFNDPQRNVRVVDATKTRLSRAVSDPGEKLRFNYDFGDDWWVSLTLEEVLTDGGLSGGELPRVIEGAGFGIVEDVGGIDGLEKLVKAFKKKKGAEYKEFSEWLGVNDFDITAFDLDDMNFRLKKIPRIYKQCYEDRMSPTKASIDLIERKYMHKK